jgi:FkbM family methyltransferase
MIIDLTHTGDYFIPEDCKNGICVDIGANCGNFLLKYADFFSLIHFYEPVEYVFNVCLDRTKHLKNIVGFNEAVFDNSDSKVNLNVHINNNSLCTAIKNDIISDEFKHEWSDNVIDSQIQTVALEKIQERLNNSIIDYMKIDCETGEYLFLIDKDLSKIRNIGIEIHNALGKERWEKLIEHILKYFNNTFNVDLSYSELQNKELYFRNKYL